MAGRIRKRLSLDAIAQARPAALLPVEPELQQAPPRSTAWHDKSGRRVRPDIERIFRTYRAVTGWVARVEKVPDHEGPDFHLWFGFEHEGKLRQHYQVVGYDSYHWAVGDPESFKWFHRVMSPGHPVTLLVPDKAGESVCVYGILEPWIYDSDGTLRWAAH